MYTWCNNRKDKDLLKEKLDRAWCNLPWINTFQHSLLEVMPIAASDHAPIILHTSRPEQLTFPKFRFEAMWLLHDRCHDVVKNVWSSNPTPVGSAGFKLISLIKRTSMALSAWNKRNVGNIMTQIQETEKELELIQEQTNWDHNTHSLTKEVVTRKRLDFLLNCEQIFWAQRAKQMWLLNDDRNTKFFHQVVKNRRNKNKILAIKDDHGNWTNGKLEILRVAELYFSRLFDNQVNHNDEASRHFIRESGIQKLSKKS